MRFLIIAIPLLLSATLVGCGSIPTDPSEKAGYYAEQAKKTFATGSETYGSYYLGLALALPTGPEKVKRVFAESPATENAYLKYLQDSIFRIGTTQQAINIQSELSRAVSTHLLAERYDKALQSQLSARITSGNTDGSIPFLISPEIANISELAASDQMSLVYNRTLSYYRENSINRNMAELIKYAMRDGESSTDAKRFAENLPSLRVRSEELDLLAPYFPNFVVERRKEITLKVHLTVKNADRLFADDIQTHFSKAMRGIIWMSVSGEDVIELSVERVRNEERVMPDSTQTVTYSYSDVNIFSAALLMPKNASYLFDLIKGGASIDYGYVIAAQSGRIGKFESVARGKVESNYKKCQNARIQNVFGGVSRAEFVANDHMQQECNGTSQVSIDDLRNQVMDSILAQTLSIPVIKATHEANL
ncbi:MULTISPECIES: hypothetical protein [unclassified Duganella]|uniref:hypothetical protein n=1 Tax=unclassified Duganella TaxID=2636909 RepID=UPI0011C1CB85|nr:MULTISPECIES: hypothetical protein [unclassified Duganella]